MVVNNMLKQQIFKLIVILLIALISNISKGDTLDIYVYGKFVKNETITFYYGDNSIKYVTEEGFNSFSVSVFIHDSIKSGDQIYIYCYYDRKFRRPKNTNLNITYFDDRRYTILRTSFRVKRRYLFEIDYSNFQYSSIISEENFWLKNKRHLGCIN
jgi:hypothetical protein